jgi:hypothetical protein
MRLKAFCCDVARLITDRKASSGERTQPFFVLLDCSTARPWSIVISKSEQVCADSMARENRRSTRVRIKIRIAAQAVTEPLVCEGETIVIKLHGALISTSIPLRVGMRIEIHVILTDKRSLGQVVYVDPERPRLCGIGLDKAQNIWGVSLPPEDWHEGD